MRRREYWDALFLAFDVGLGSSLVFIVGMHTPITTFTEPETFLLTRSFGEILVQTQVVADGVLKATQNSHSHKVY